MAKKINRLTAEQEAMLPAWRDRYFAAGASTERADRPRAEAAFARAYATIGKEPVPVLWVDSPASASLFLVLMKSKSSFLRSLPTKLENTFGPELRSNLGGSISRTLWLIIPDISTILRELLIENISGSLVESLRRPLDKSAKIIVDALGQSLSESLTNLSSNLDNSLRSTEVWTDIAKILEDRLENGLDTNLKWGLVSSLWNSVLVRLADGVRKNLQSDFFEEDHRHLRESLVLNLWDSLKTTDDHTNLYVPTYWVGSHDNYWIAFYKFCETIGVKYVTSAADRLDIMHEIGMSCGWWYPRDGIVIACDRPTINLVDEQFRLHSEIGPAMAFADGYAIWAIHGVRVPSHVIEKKITLTAINAEHNAEIKRVMIERYGWDRYVKSARCETIDNDDRWGTLMRSPAGLFLKVVNRSPEPDGTFRNYILPLSSRCEPLPDPSDPNGRLGSPQKLTALNAVASTFGMTGAKYAEIAAES